MGSVAPYHVVAVVENVKCRVVGGREDPPAGRVKNPLAAGFWLWRLALPDRRGP